MRDSPAGSLPLPEQVHRCFFRDDPQAARKQLEEANVRLVRDMYESILRGDFNAIVERFTEDVEWEVIGPAELPFCGSVRGRREAASTLRRNFSGYQHIQATVRDVVAQGNLVVVMCRETVLLEPLEEPVEIEWVQVFTIVNGRLAKFCQFFDTLTMKRVVERIVG
jgi:ketosteroid isomerase-like protein